MTDTRAAHNKSPEEIAEEILHDFIMTVANYDLIKEEIAAAIRADRTATLAEFREKVLKALPSEEEIVDKSANIDVNFELDFIAGAEYACQRIEQALKDLESGE